MKFDILEFIDSPDVRKYNQETYFSPAKQSVLIAWSKKKTMEEKIEALEYLLENYSKEEFDDSEIRGEWHNRDITIYQVAQQTLHLWKKLMEERNDIKGIVYQTQFYERGYKDCNCGYFSTYEKAYQYLENEKKLYLKDNDLKNVKTYGVITRIQVDNDREYNRYYYDTDMRLVEITTGTDRYDVDGELPTGPLNYYFFYIGIPFHIGDIVKNEDYLNELRYGVLHAEHLKHKNPDLNCFFKCIDYFDSENKMYDFVEDINLLTMEYCTVEEIPEDKRYYLKLLSKIRKREVIFT